jgi:F0F1-type ATP synthase membrane subunit b/b'
MSDGQTQSEDPIQRGLDELKTIGRELGGRLKDASEDVKQAWEKLQPRIAKADEAATQKTDEMTTEVKHATAAVIDDIKAQLQKLRRKLDDA